MTGDLTGAYAFPLSIHQRPMWQHELAGGLGSAYHMVCAHRLVGSLATEALAAAVNAVVARHEALRTVFRRVAGEPRQVVLPSLDTPVEFVDRSGHGPGSLPEVVQDRIERPFDLETGPLLRPVLVRLAPEVHLLVLVVHHLVGDGWSLGVVVDDITAHYQASVEGVPAALAPPAMQYPDFTLWERDALPEHEIHRQVEHWRAALRGHVPTPALLPGRGRGDGWDNRAETTAFTIGDEVVGPLEALGRASSSTLNMTVMAVFQAVVGGLSGLDRFVVATASARRVHTEFADMVGLVANFTVPVGADLTGDPTFRELTRRVRRAVVAAMNHPDVPVDRVLAALAPAPPRCAPPLLPIAFQLLHADPRPRTAGGVRFEEVAATTRHVYSELSLTAVRADDLECAVTWTTAHHDRDTIDRLVAAFGDLLARVGREPDAPIRRLLHHYLRPERGRA